MNNITSYSASTVVPQYCYYSNIQNSVKIQTKSNPTTVLDTDKMNIFKSLLVKYTQLVEDSTTKLIEVRKEAKLKYPTLFNNNG